MKKNLEIMVVEDNAKHLADAKAEAQRIIATGIPLTLSYAQTYEEAAALINRVKLNGIISDVFFPWGTQIRDGKIQGWNPEVARRCYEALCSFSGLNEESKRDYDWTIKSINFETPAGKPLITEIPQWMIDHGGRPITAKRYQEAQRWQNGESMHPTGVVVAEDARYSNIPTVFCTDTNHHGFTTEPISQYARKYGIPLVDATPQDLGKDWKGGNASSKHWDQAIQSLLVAMVVGEQSPNLPRQRGYEGEPELDLQKSMAFLEPHLKGYNLPKEFVEQVIYSMLKWQNDKL